MREVGDWACVLWWLVLNRARAANLGALPIRIHS